MPSDGGIGAAAPGAPEIADAPHGAPTPSETASDGGTGADRGDGGDEGSDAAAAAPGIAAGESDPESAPPKHIWAVVMVFEIAVDLPAPHALVTLREVAEPHRLVALPVGLPEATALAHAWRGVPTPRPLTHELFADVLVRLGATIEVVRLHGRRAGVVLAEMELTGPRGREVVSCRPTDGLTLAIRQGVAAPILLDVRLFEPEGDVDPDG
jgi:hypothetical protein